MASNIKKVNLTNAQLKKFAKALQTGNGISLKIPKERLRLPGSIPLLLADRQIKQFKRAKQKGTGTTLNITKPQMESMRKDVQNGGVLGTVLKIALPILASIVAPLIGKLIKGKGEGLRPLGTGLRPLGTGLRPLGTGRLPPFIDAPNLDRKRPISERVNPPSVSRARKTGGQLKQHTLPVSKRLFRREVGSGQHLGSGRQGADEFRFKGTLPPASERPISGKKKTTRTGGRFLEGKGLAPLGVPVRRT